MKSLREFIVAVKRRETPFYDRLYRIAKAVLQVSMPVVPPIHGVLYNEWAMRTNFWHKFWQVTYYEPMFKSQCQSVGKGFRMHYAGNGITRIAGDLQLYLGSNVTIYDNTMFAGLKVYDKPELHIGNNTYIGPGGFIFVAKKITIGSNCMISCKLLADNTGHSLYNTLKRMAPGGGAPDPESIRPVVIGDFCGLGIDTVVYPGVTIGDGVVSILGTHISRDVPPFCLVSGNPMKIRMKLAIPPEIADIVGEKRYREYLECHEKVKIRK